MTKSNYDKTKGNKIEVSLFIEFDNLTIVN